MDNRAPDYKLSLPDGGHLLRDALNVDVTAQGTVKTRADPPGTTKCRQTRRSGYDAPQSGLSARALAGRLAAVLLEHPMANTLYPKGKQKMLGGTMRSFQPTKILRPCAAGVR